MSYDARPMRTVLAGALAIVALAVAIGLGLRASDWNDELALAPPLAAVAPVIADPHTPRLARRVVLVIIDGLGADEAQLPFLDELGHRGVAATASVPYPTISRPNYVTILTGVPPRDSGVRTNRVRAPVALDSLMDRVRAAGLHVATASDYGMVASLFVHGTPSIMNVEWREAGDRLSPPPPLTWPFDDVRRLATLDTLGPALAELVAGDAAFIPVLVLDVDRAGHAAGVGDEYRAAATAVDQMLRTALAGLDLTRDAVIITADHGHVARGGHGGTEPEVSHVPLVLAGSGIVAGDRPRDARLVDLAPTIAALLGVAAPGHAEGRTLVELLALAPDAAGRRVEADTARSRMIVGAIASSHDGPEAWRLALAVGGALGALVVVLVLRGRGLVVIPKAAPVGALAFATMLAAVAIVARCNISPSSIPSAARVQWLGAISAALAIAVQTIAVWRVIRGRDRLAAANGVALIGLAIVLVAVALVRAWFSPPFIDVPSPFWFVAIPAFDLAAATCGLATAIGLVAAHVAARRGRE